MSILPRPSLFLLIGLLMSTQSGCITLSALMGQKRSPQLDTTLLEMQGYSVPPGGLPASIGLADSNQPQVVLEVRGDGKEKHLERIPLPTDRSVFIQDLVQQAQLSEHLGRLEISIMRPNGPAAPPVRLDLRTDDNGKPTSMGSNYALLPGDHIIVLNDQRSGLERFIAKQFLAR